MKTTKKILLSSLTVLPVVALIACSQQATTEKTIEVKDPKLVTQAFNNTSVVIKVENIPEGTKPEDISLTLQKADDQEKVTISATEIKGNEVTFTFKKLEDKTEYQYVKVKVKTEEVNLPPTKFTTATPPNPNDTPPAGGDNPGNSTGSGNTVNNPNQGPQITPPPSNPPDADRGIAVASPEIFNDKNQAVALNNVKATGKDLLQGFSEMLEFGNKVEAKLTNGTRKTAFKNFLTILENVKDKFNSSGSLNAKIGALNSSATDYATKLNELVNEVKEQMSTLATAYTTYAAETSFTGASAEDLGKTDLIKTWAELKLLPVAEQTPTDLVKNLESKQRSNKYTQKSQQEKEAFEQELTSIGTAGNSSDPTQTSVFNDLVKYLGQSFNLMLKQQNQSLFLAKAIENKIPEDKLKTSFAKQNPKFAPRIYWGFVHSALEKKVNGLEAQLTALRSELTNVKNATVANGVNLSDENKKSLVDFEDALVKLEKAYKGLDTVDSEFVRPGIKALTQSLKTGLHVTQGKSINSVKEFNYFYQKTAELANMGDGLAVNVTNSVLLVNQAAKLISDYKNIVHAKINSLAKNQKAPYQAIESAISTLQNKINPLVEDYESLDKPVDPKDKNNSYLSVPLLNQYTNSLISLAQLYLAQGAADHLEEVNEKEALLN